MIDRKDPLPMTKQCTLLELSRSSMYSMPVLVNDTDRELMRLIDEIHLDEPYLGSRGMKNALRMRGHRVGRIHVRTLMRKMGIQLLHHCSSSTWRFVRILPASHVTSITN